MSHTSDDLVVLETLHAMQKTVTTLAASVELSLRMQLALAKLLGFSEEQMDEALGTVTRQIEEVEALQRLLGDLDSDEC